jgi:hypothetical protein
MSTGKFTSQGKSYDGINKSQTPWAQAGSNAGLRAREFDEIRRRQKEQQDNLLGNAVNSAINNKQLTIDPEKASGTLGLPEGFLKVNENAGKVMPGSLEATHADLYQEQANKLRREASPAFAAAKFTRDYMSDPLRRIMAKESGLTDQQLEMESTEIYNAGLRTARDVKRVGASLTADDKIEAIAVNLQQNPQMANMEPAELWKMAQEMYAQTELEGNPTKAQQLFNTPAPAPKYKSLMSN